MWQTKLHFAGLFVGTALLVSACGGGSNMPTVGSTDPGQGACPMGVGGMPSSCCDSNGIVLQTQPPGPGCINMNLGSAPVAGASTNGAGSAGGSLGDIGTAQKLVGGELATGMGGQFSAATAAGKPGGTSELGSAFSNPSGLAANNLNPTSGSAGGAPPGGGSGSGSGLDPNSVSTAPAPSASDKPNVSGATAGNGGNVADGAAGGGSGVLPNGARSTGFQFGNGFSGGGEGGSATDLAFGKSSGGVDPLLGSDPEDYFTRIGISDNLFKKVERRYRDTSMHWASAETHSPSRSTASVVAPNGMAK